MNHKQKIGYTILGASIMLIGMWIGNGTSPPVTAQSNGVFDKITCREIEVIDENGTGGISIRGGSIIVSGNNGFTNVAGGVVFLHSPEGRIVASMEPTEHGGRIDVFNKQGESQATMGINEYSGEFRIYGKNGKTTAYMGTIEDGGHVVVCNNQGKTRAAMGTIPHGGSFTTFGKGGKLGAVMSDSEYGGKIGVFNNQGKNRAVMSVNEYGNGAVSTWDKNGYRQ